MKDFPTVRPPPRILSKDADFIVSTESYEIPISEWVTTIKLTIDSC